jgi:peptide/nickel transport system ATP-binding protein
VEIADSIAVMYAGRLIEQADAAALYRAPRHPYTLGLLRSFPALHGDRARMTGIPGSPPDLRTPPPGCPFHPRCGYAMDRCRTEVPVTLQLGSGGRSAACWLHAGGATVPPELARLETDTAGADAEPTGAKLAGAEPAGAGQEPAGQPAAGRQA